MGFLILNLSVIFLYSVMVIAGEIHVETWRYINWRRALKAILSFYLLTVLLGIGIVGAVVGLHYTFN